MVQFFFFINTADIMYSKKLDNIRKKENAREND